MVDLWNKERIISGTDTNLASLAGRLRAGELVCFPTETVYGLGASALSDEAVKNIYRVKGRPSHNPLIVHVHSLAAVQSIIDCKARPELWGRVAQASRFWPGPLSLVLPRGGEICKTASAGLESIAVRIPNHPLALALLEQTGIPLAAPSANPSGYISPTTASHVLSAFPHENFPILDGGACRGGIESTVLSLLDEEPVILRPGLITKAQIEEALGMRVAMYTPGDSSALPSVLPSPGLLEKHYSPHTPSMLLSSLVKHQELLSGKRLALLAVDQETADIPFQFECIFSLGSGDNMEKVAARFYACLREADQGGFDYIVLDDDLENTGLGSAILDRMRRAAA